MMSMRSFSGNRAAVATYPGRNRRNISPRIALTGRSGAMNIVRTSAADMMFATIRSSGLSLR